MEYGRVAVKALVNVDRQLVSRSDVETMANAIMTLGMAIRPVIVCKRGWNEEIGAFTYEVIDNHLTAAAAQLANQCSPVKHEMIDAFIVGKGDNINAIYTQLQM